MIDLLSVAQRLFVVSRPRFWIYLIGPFLIGSAAGWVSFEGIPPFWYAALLLFTLPMNAWIYGVNDLCDLPTDRLNPKKHGYEQMLDPAFERALWWGIGLIGVVIIALIAVLPLPAAWGVFGTLALGWAYSVPPLRTKVIPLLDAATNVLYIAPAIVGYTLLAGGWPPVVPFVAGWLWCMAMHAYSAVPDIQADRAAGLSTIATWLGARATLIVCAICYTLAAISTAQLTSGWSLLFLAVYLVQIVRTDFARNQPSRVLALYTQFPLLNSTIGFLLFVLTALTRLTT